MHRRDFIDKVISTMAQHGMTKPGDLVLVGVSGGPDSVALLHVLWVLRERLGIRLHVGHLNHMIRGEAADEDAAYVSRLAQRLGVPAVIEARDVVAVARRDHISLELAARRVRYEFYRETADSLRATRVALGHHAGDQAETVLLRLLRGTGTTGLAGIPPVRSLLNAVGRLGRAEAEEECCLSEDAPEDPRGVVAAGSPTIIRPLIEVTREEIEDYCTENDLRPRMDASNLATEFTRNKVRRELIPVLARHYNPHIVESIARTAQLVREDEAFISGEVMRRMRRVVLGVSASRALLGVERLLAEHPAVQRRLVREVIALVACADTDIEFEHIEMVLELARKGLLGASATLPRGLRARKLRYVPEREAERGGLSGVMALRSPSEVVLEIEVSPGAGLDGGGGIGALGPQALDVPGACGPGEFSGCKLSVPGVTIIPQLGLSFEAEILETDRRGGVCLPARPDQGGVFEAYFDIDKLGTDIAVRTRRSGDRIVPFGMEGHKKLKELLIDEKVPRNIRDLVPVIVAGKEILWVVGVRRSNLARVDASTRRVLRLSVRPNAAGDV